MSHNIESKSFEDLLLPDIKLSKSTSNSPRTSGLLDKHLSADIKQRCEVFSSFTAATNATFKD